ncbi:helix-turn-helix domain-containing protein [Paraburkholderia sp. JHI869]|uniref:helix-turn-helix domain-containing protein n=1 Tax=Paraburkholderia sp. JHI869 TaxID=3112959 RepID=UPI003176EEBF
MFTLKTGNDSLSRIAAAVGYTSETTFSSTFKKMFGLSPGRYRSEARKQGINAAGPGPTSQYLPDNWKIDS